MNNKIISWSDYQARLDTVQNLNKQAEENCPTINKENYLQAYDDLLQLREQGFPLLLQEGKPYTFDLPPVNAYLLPPLKNNQQDRWLLVFFVTEGQENLSEEQSWVQLLIWTTSETGTTQISPLAGQERQSIDKCSHRLDKKNIELHFVETGYTCTINLVFLEGILTLVANTNQGIIVSAWQDQHKNDPWIERYSFGDMKTAIKIRRYGGKNNRWQDDVVEDENGRVLLSGDAEIGRIRGSDGAEQQSSLVYLASNRGYIYRLDKNRPGRPPLCSEPLYNEVLDVLALPWTASSYKLLAAVRNGTVYMLEDKATSISICHWQHTGNPIWRLIGRGDRHLLSMDERQALLPLRLNNPIEAAATQNKATRWLAKTVCREELIDFLNNPLAILIDDKNKFLHLGQLAFEFFLVEFDTDSGSNAWLDFGGWCIWLNESYDIAPTQHKTLMLLHKRLIKRVFRRVQTSCFKDQRKQFNNYEAVRSAIDVLLEILTLRPSAPDALWILLFRQYDWLRLWAEKTKLIEHPKFAERLNRWEQELNQQRLNFSYGLGRIRPLNTLSSLRLLSQATHIDRIDDNRIALIVANRDLCILKISPSGTVWEKQLHVTHGKHWQGQAQFVQVLSSSANQPLRFLVGTLRGELVTLRWNGQKGSTEVSEKHKTDCGFAVVTSLRLDKYEGYLLLGGRNSKGQACLYGLPASGDMNSLRQFWNDDEEEGSICVLRSSKDDKQLWALNRDSGKCYCWDIKPQLTRSNAPLLANKRTWLNTIHKLHALQYSEQHNLLVCGGDGGLAIALNAVDGSLRWVVNCAGNLRHIAYLPDYNQREGVWLLCSDERSSLMVANDGCVVGVLENAGPVSAVKVVHEKLLLATMDGRLLLMGAANPNAAPAEFKSLENYWGSYPVRGETRSLSSENLSEILNFDHKEIKETLIKMMLLRLVADFISEKPCSRALTEAFDDFWQQQNLARKILFLNWLRTLWLKPDNLADEALTTFTLALLQSCWQDLSSYQETNLLCNFISPILDILDVLDSLKNQEAQALRQTMTECIWRLHENVRDCPEILRQGIAAIRLNQVLKRWHQLNNEPASDEHRLFIWCNAVAEQSKITETEPLRELLKQLFQNHLRLLKEGHSWQSWLINLTNEPETESLAPRLLGCLQPNSGLPMLADSDWLILSGLFGNNSVWQRWLENLQSALAAVRNANQAQPHKAWAEHSALRRLREHIVSIGAERFTVTGQQALLALWWRQLEASWSGFIDDRLRELEVNVRENPEQYLTLDSLDHWQDSRHLKLTLTFNNRFPAHLNLDSVLWQKQSMPNTKLPIVLPADDSTRQHDVDLTTSDLNHISGKLTLICSNVESGHSFSLNYEITKDRNLSRFSADPHWRETWDRLDQLLSSYTELNENFYWIDGEIWSTEERKQLKQDVKNKYNLSVNEQLRVTPELITTSNSARVFSPDLALSAPPRVQLEQLHALMQPWLGPSNKVYWALALWREAHGLPDSINAALSRILPEREVIMSALNNLLGSTEKTLNLIAALAALPARAVGAWCGNEPFYALKPEESHLAEAVYLPAASLLTAEVWILLDSNNIAAAVLAVFLDIKQNVAEQQKRQRKIFQTASIDLFSTGIADPNLADQAAQLLLSKLGNRSVSYELPVWWLKTALTLNWQDFNRVYLLPKATAVDRAKLRSMPEGLWLCLGESVAPTDLTGTAIALSEQQALALLHTELHNEKASEALLWLNRIAGTQHSIDPTLVFRSAAGLGAGIEKHFCFRGLEIKTLWNCLKDADNPNGWGSALIIGGRRMGKTCLRERILFEVRNKQPERICLSFNFEGQSGLSQSKMHGIELEFWFFQKMAEKFAECGQPFEYSWPSAYKHNETWRGEARVRLHQHLSALKSKTGHAVLFAFDETEHLVKADTRNKNDRYALFSFLRSLSQESRICLIATSYPFGADYPHALNIANHDSGSPCYNTFAQKIKLPPWSPEQTWDYLHVRLSGFGVILPRQYRDEVIAISRGVPWIVHAFGLFLCKTLLETNSTSKIVNSQIWHSAKNEVLKEIHKELKESVERAAQFQDQQFNISFDSYPVTALSQGHLWTALINLARKQALPIFQDANIWTECLGINVYELEALLPTANKTALRETLKRLAASPALEGDDTDGDRYIFANNLLPIWLHYSKGDLS